MLTQHPVNLTFWFSIASLRALSLASHSGWLLTGKHFPRSSLRQYLFNICLPIRWKHWESMSGGTQVSLLSITMPDTLASSLLVSTPGLFFPQGLCMFGPPDTSWLDPCHVTALKNFSNYSELLVALVAPCSLYLVIFTAPATSWNHITF